MNEILETIRETRDVKQVSGKEEISPAAIELLINQNSVIMGQLSYLQTIISKQAEQPLKAALERKRLSVIGQCPSIGKDMLVKFQSSSYTTTDTNVIKEVLKPLLAANGISYQCTPLNHTTKPSSSNNSSYLHDVALQFCVTDVETGYTEIIPGEWRGVWMGSIDKGYSSAITNGIGKFLVNYFNISSFDRPEENAADEFGNTVSIRERKSTATSKKAGTTPENEQQITKAELDYQQARAVFSAIKTAEALKAKYEELVKQKTHDKAQLKRAFIERHYQLSDLDLSDENQYKFIAENWNGTLYKPNGKQANYRIFVCNAEISISDTIVKQLQELAQYKQTK